MWWTRHSSGILERMTHSNSEARNGPAWCRERWARCSPGRRPKSLAIGKRKKYLRSMQMVTLISGCRSATWRWNRSCRKSAVTCTLIGKRRMSNTHTECAVLSSSALSDKKYHTINICICTHTLEWNNPKTVGGEEVRFYWWLITSLYGSSKEDCARETRRACKLALRHHVLRQKWEAQPIRIDTFVSHRRCETVKAESRMAHGDVGLQLAKSQQGRG